MEIIPLLIITLTFILAIYLIITGRKGKLTSTHIHCTNCQYSLHKLQDAKNCPECGANLTNEYATQQGLIKKSKTKIIIGLTLIILTIYPFISPNTNSLNKFKPQWWLNQELASSNTQTADNARKELITRINNKTLTKQDALAYIHSLENIAQNPNQTYPKHHTQILYVLLDSNLITTKQIKTRIIPAILKLQKRKKAWAPILGTTARLLHQQKHFTKKTMEIIPPTRHQLHLSIQKNRRNRHKKPTPQNQNQYHAPLYI